MKKRRLKKKKLIRLGLYLLILIGGIILITKSCNKENINLDCVESILRAYISNENNVLKEIPIEDILKENKRGIKESQVVLTNNNWTYAIVKTKNKKVLQELEEYFKENFQGYNYQELKDNYYIYFYNGYDNINFDELKSCVLK